MVRFKVFLGAPRLENLTSQCREDLIWQKASTDTSQDSEKRIFNYVQGTQNGDEEQEDLYANTIFGKNNSVQESRNWDLPSSSFPGLYTFLETIIL